MDEGGVTSGEGAGGGDELAAVLEVVLRAHPDAVPELIGGATIAEMLASVEPARAAFTRISERLKPVGSAPPIVPPVVPAGAGGMAVDPATLPSGELIRRGVGERRRK